MSFDEFSGTARLDRRTKRLVRRLGPDDIAIIDHADIDRVSAEELLESGVRVVFNTKPSVTGRFPNPGPLQLVRGGVRLIDVPGADLFDQVRDGEHLTVRGASLFRLRTRLAAGRSLSAEELELRLAQQQDRLAEALGGFADNTMRFLRDEASVLTADLQLPQLQTRFRDRHALVVARGPAVRRDLRIVRPYVREFKPVLVAVDGGADALLEEGHRPDVIVGDMDSVSDRALASGAEIVVHAYPDGRAPGRDRVDRLGLPSTVVRAPGISEDVAMLLAHEKGAELIVVVGTHFNLIEFLERNREGMSSTFLTRLKVGDRLVDARGVSLLFPTRVGVWPLVGFTLAAAGAIAAVVVASDPLRDTMSVLVRRLFDLVGLG
jgi:uncharacterized membrane-anchored protein